MKVTATVDNLYVVLELIRNFAKEQRIDSEKLHQLELAVEEIVVNIISYAYPSDIPGDIDIHCRLPEENKALIEIIDWGIPFDPLAIPEPDTESDLEDREIGGLGIFFARQIMDEVQYRRDNGKNILRLIMYLPADEELP